MTKYKLLLDANVLIAASMYYASKTFKKPLKHDFYDECKALINFFEKNIDKKIGIYTKRVDREARGKLQEVMLSIAEETPKSQKVSDGALLKTQSEMFSEIVRSYEQNKEVLIRETVNKKTLSKWEKQVFTFYTHYLPSQIERMNPEAKMAKIRKIKGNSFQMKAKRAAGIEEERRKLPTYRVLKRKFIDRKPSVGDILLLAQAKYFNDLYASDDIKFLFVSKDQHFARMNFEGEFTYFVPHEIEKRFGVLCKTPTEAFEIIK